MNGVYFDRYWLPVTMLFAPVLALCLSGEENAALRRMALLLFVGTTLLVSAMCMAHSMAHKQAEEDMRMAAIDEARAQGLDKGYATFWNANILTELSDGEIDVTALDWTHNAAGEESMKPQRWLEAEQSFVMDRPEEPVFLLVGGWESEGIEPFLERVQAKKAEIGGYIDFYTIPRQALLFEAMGE